MTTLSTHDTKRSEDVRARLLRSDRAAAGVGRRGPRVAEAAAAAPLPRGLARRRPPPT